MRKYHLSALSESNLNLCKNGYNKIIDLMGQWQKSEIRNLNVPGSILTLISTCYKKEFIMQ